MNRPDGVDPVLELLNTLAHAMPTSLAAEFQPERLAELFDCLRLLEHKWPTEARQSRGEEAGALAATPPHLFGRFQIVRELGRGGCGIVFLAFDPVLRRQVALKVPRPEILLTPELRRRFLREAHASAGLDHSNIVPVFEAGEEGPVVYLVSAYCDGPTLAAWLRQRQDLAPVRTAAALVAALADGAQHAHSRGILHRDLKPSNVLLEPRPSDALPFTPRLADFGLAKLVDPGSDGRTIPLGLDESDQTRPGILIGSPRYMAPEQAEGRTTQISPATDVYGLGVILYELLVGRPPFVGDSDVATVRMVIDEEPLPPRQLRPDIPADLEAICLRCLEKESAGRYPSADRLADDLRRFLSGWATAARPLGPVGRLLRWARRRPVVSALVVLCLAVTGVALWLGGRLSSQGQQLKLAAHSAELQEFHVLLERLQQRRLERAAGWVEANLNDLRQLAALAPAMAFQDALSTEAAAALAAPRLRLLRELAVGKNAYVCAFAPDGQTLALGERYPVLPGELRVWLVRTTGEDLGELRYPVDHEWEKGRGMGRADGARALAYSPDGRWLVLGTRGGRVVRWNLAGPQPRPVCCQAHTREGTDHTGDEVRSLLFSHDSAILLSGSVGKHFCVWNIREGWTGPKHHVGLLAGGTSRARETTWVFRQSQHPRQYRLERFDLRTGQRTGEGIAPSVHAFCLSEQGDYLAASTDRTGVDLWLFRPDDLSRRPLLAPALPGEHAEVKEMLFTHDGRWLLSSSAVRGQLEMWDVVRGELVATAKLRGGSVRLAASPTGRYVAVCEQGRTLLFEVSDGPVRSAVGESGRVNHLVLSADGACLATAGVDGFQRIGANGLPGGFRTPVTLYHRDKDGLIRQRHLRLPMTGIPGGPRLALSPAPGGLGLVLAAPADGQPGLQVLDGAWMRAGKVNDVHIGPDNHVWAINAGDKLIRWSGQGPVETMHVVPAAQERAGGGLDTFLPTAHGTLLGRADGKILWLDLRGQARGPWTVFLDQQVTALAIRADGAEALVGGSLGAVARIALPSGALLRPAEPLHRDAVVGLAYLPDGTTLTASADHSIRLWNPQGRALGVLREGGPIARIALSPGGRELYVLVKGEWGVRLWQLSHLRDQLAALGLTPGFVSGAAPSRFAPSTAHGLVVERFADAAFTDLIERRRDNSVNHADDAPPSWLLSPSQRWTGWLCPPQPGRWEVQWLGDDEMTLWIDGRTVLRHRHGDRPSLPRTALFPATPVSFRLDRVSRTRRSRCQLLWRPAGSSEAFVPIPPSAFLRVCLNMFPLKKWAFLRSRRPVC